MGKIIRISLIGLGILSLVLALIILRDISAAQVPETSSGLPLPRFVSLRAKAVNMRTGPGVRYPVDWVYKRRNMPMEVVKESGTWRKVRDFQGTQGWMHQGMLSNKRALVVTGQTRTLRNHSDSKSAAVARIEPGAVGQVIQCQGGVGWCNLSFGSYEGWLRRVEIWGVYPGENIK